MALPLDRTIAVRDKSPMVQSPKPQQLRHEANRVHEVDELLGVTWTPTPTDRVITLPQSSYRPPTFLRRIASPDEVAGLEKIFDELRELNEGMPARGSLEVEAFYALTGSRRDRNGSAHRLVPHVLRETVGPDVINPKDGGSPFRRFRGSRRSSLLQPDRS